MNVVDYLSDSSKNVFVRIETNGLIGKQGDQRELIGTESERNDGQIERIVVVVVVKFFQFE